VAITKGVNGRDLIAALLEMTGKEYCENVTAVTITARVGSVVIVNVEMVAEEVKDK
jgi:hypothetical protein